jgi:sulfate adenylyltransferase
MDAAPGRRPSLHDTVSPMPGLPTPYGGVLVSALLDLSRAGDRLRALGETPSWGLTPSQLVDVELLLTGAFSPLRGFMTAEHAEASALGGRLPDGLVWPAPIVLEVDETIARTLAPRGRLILRDFEGTPVALLTVDDVWSTTSVAGLLEGLRLPPHQDFAALRLAPTAVRAVLEEQGWSRVLALPLAGSLTPDVAREALDAAQRLDAGLLVLGLLPPGGLDAADHFPRVRGLLTAYATLPTDRARLIVLPWNGAASLERERVLRAIVARNYGCTHLALGRGAEMAALDDVGIAGVEVASPFERPDRAALGLPPPTRRGVTVFFTGLSGSGKSTIANLVRVRLLEHGARAVTLLDGDLVRRHLSSELGFSREHRELNVRRIAYVAAEIARHGGLTICAPIAPYDDGRREARALVQAVGDFVLVFVDTPLEVCEQRDPKGLYAKARAGLVPAFTGVSDPYERPADAEIVVDTTTMTASDAADHVMSWLTARGYLG